jgi:hypothetical protein
MSIKYVAVNGYMSFINKVEISRETDSSVFINGNCYRKRTEYEAYFDTFKEAQRWLIAKSEYALDKARTAVRARQQALIAVTGLTEDEL